MHLPKFEIWLRAFSVFSFCLIAWVAHRSLRMRENCVQSPMIAYVRWVAPGGATTMVENCQFVSRLKWSNETNRIDATQAQDLRRLEAAQSVASWIRGNGAELSIQLVEGSDFAVERRALRLGRDWLADATQLARALTMAQLKTEQWTLFGNAFQLEVATDFLMAALNGPDLYHGTLDHDVSLKNEARFATLSNSFSQYCRSPFRSLAHARACAAPVLLDADDLFVRVWGLKAALVNGLWRTFIALPLASQIEVLGQFRSGVSWPLVSALPPPTAEGLSQWLDQTMRSYAHALGMDKRGDSSLKRAMVEIGIDAPVHWELTVDLTHTPAWKEILRQLKNWSHFRFRERALLFTPEGQVALPSGLEVNWRTGDILSQKHVLIACGWPKPKEAVSVHARQTFLEQSCTKLDRAFWD